jgi:uroporphyrinogen-III synthase
MRTRRARRTLDGPPRALPRHGGHGKEPTLTLEGVRVAVTAHRKGAELVAALERRGASVLHAPTIAGDVPVPHEQILADTAAVLDASPDWLVASTGVGMRLWAEAAADGGHLDALRAMAARARCVARGPKAVGGLAALGARPVWTSARQTDADVAGWLERRVLRDEVVAVQLHGAAVTSTFRSVQRAGADLVSVATYRHAMPDDLAPAQQLVSAIASGAVDVVVLTSPGAARNLVAIADRADPATRAAFVAAFDEVATAVIGPVTASALEECGIPVWFTPRRWRTGDLLRSLERWAERRAAWPDERPRLRLLPNEDAVVTPRGTTVTLGQRGYAVLAALARRPGVVCPPEQLLSEAWGFDAPADPSAIKHQIARLRRKLDGTGVDIRTIRGVGYRLDGSEAS